MENPIEMDDLGVYNPIFGNTQLCWLNMDHVFIAGLLLSPSSRSTSSHVALAFVRTWRFESGFPSVEELQKGLEVNCQLGEMLG